MGVQFQNEAPSDCDVFGSRGGGASQRGSSEVATGPGERPLQVQTKAARGSFWNTYSNCPSHKALEFKKGNKSFAEECGLENPNGVEDRIVGGHEAAHHEWPWQVALFVKIESDLAHAGLNSDHVVAMASNRSIVFLPLHKFNLIFGIFRCFRLWGTSLALELFRQPEHHLVVLDVRTALVLHDRAHHWYCHRNLPVLYVATIDVNEKLHEVFVGCPKHGKVFLSAYLCIRVCFVATDFKILRLFDDIVAGTIVLAVPAL